MKVRSTRTCTLGYISPTGLLAGVLREDSSIAQHQHVYQLTILE